MRVRFAAATMDLANVKVKVTASIGVASAETFGYELDVLLHEADMAVYDAKRQGRTRSSWRCRWLPSTSCKRSPTPARRLRCCAGDHHRYGASKRFPEIFAKFPTVIAHFAFTKAGKGTRVDRPFFLVEIDDEQIAQAFLMATALVLLPGSAAFAVDNAAALKALDPDDDGTIDLKEADAGALKASRKSTRIMTGRWTRRSSRAGSPKRRSRPPIRTMTERWTRKNTWLWSRRSSKPPIRTMTARSISRSSNSPGRPELLKLIYK